MLMIEWISVEDELPATSQSVLVVDSDGYMSTAGCYVTLGWVAESFEEEAYDNNCNYMGGPERILCKPTHWMPLPEPPTKEIEGGE